MLFGTLHCFSIAQNISTVKNDQNNNIWLNQIAPFSQKHICSLKLKSCQKNNIFKNVYYVIMNVFRYNTCTKEFNKIQKNIKKTKDLQSTKEYI